MLVVVSNPDTVGREGGREGEGLSAGRSATITTSKTLVEPEELRTEPEMSWPIRMEHRKMEKRLPNSCAT